MFLILVRKIAQILAEVQEHKLSFIKIGQLKMAHMFRYQLLNQIHKVSKIEHALQEWL